MQKNHLDSFITEATESVGTIKNHPVHSKRVAHPLRANNARLIMYWRGIRSLVVWTCSNFVCLLLVLLPTSLGNETISSINPPTGTVSTSEWSIVYHGSQVESARKKTCKSVHSSDSSAVLQSQVILTGDCIGGLNSFKNSFFRSHRRRHEYFAARLSDPHRMYFKVSYDVYFDLTWMQNRMAIWQTLLLDPKLSEWQFKIEVQDSLTGIPWYSRQIPFAEMSQLLTAVTENGNSKVNSTAQFVMAWDLILNERVQLVDVHRKPFVAYENISSSEHSLANDRTPFLLSATSLIDCPACSTADTEDLRARLLSKQLLEDPIPVTITNVAVQYLSPPTKVVFDHLDHSRWQYVDSFSGQSFHRHPDEVYDMDRDVFYDPCILQRTNVSSLLDRIKISWGVYPGSVDSRWQVHNTSPLPRIFCGIYSTQRHHDTKIAAIRSTWARKCTAFLVFSTVDDPSIPSVSVPHIGDESYDNMWQKSRAIWRYIHRHYLREFDFFLLGGDDMYYIMENLYEYLNSPTVLNASPSSAGIEGLYIGRTMRYEEGNDVDIHQSGGAGYLLDQKALNALFSHVPLSWVNPGATENTDPTSSDVTVPIFEYADVCTPTLRTSAEDAQLGKCLRAIGIHAMDTRDEHGHDRFHFLSPDLLSSFDPEEHRNSWVVRLPLHPVKPIPDCCSTHSISFHYLSAWGQYAIDALLYKCKHSSDRQMPSSE